MFKRLSKFLLEAPFNPVKLPITAKFPVNDSLLGDQKAARAKLDLMGVEMKPLRKVAE